MASTCAHPTNHSKRRDATRSSRHQRPHPGAALTEPLPQESHIDKDDDKFVDCAITANADYIVTEDSHFDHLKQIPFPKLNVLTLDEFLEERLDEEK